MTLFKRISNKLTTSLLVTVLTALSQTQWTQRNPLPSDAHLFDVVWTGSQYVIVGSTIQTSPDGITWTTRKADLPGTLNDVVRAGNQFVAVGENETVMVSTDGASWSSVSTGVSSNFSGITWTGNLIVAVGEFGTVMTSPDGATWTEQNSGTFEGLTDIIWTGNELVAIGIRGTILTSVDGTAWTPQTAGTFSYLQSITLAGNQLVAVGWGGAILTSPLSTPVVHDSHYLQQEQSPLQLSIVSHSHTKLSFTCSITSQTPVSANLYNLRGQSVVSIRKRAAGTGREKMHLPLNCITAGVYFLAVEAGGYREKMMVVVR